MDVFFFLPKRLIERLVADIDTKRNFSKNFIITTFTLQNTLHINPIWKKIFHWFGSFDINFFFFCGFAKRKIAYVNKENGWLTTAYGNRIKISNGKWWDDVDLMWENTFVSCAWNWSRFFFLSISHWNRWITTVLKPNEVGLCQIVIPKRKTRQKKTTTTTIEYTQLY